MGKLAEAIDQLSGVSEPFLSILRTLAKGGTVNINMQDLKDAYDFALRALVLLREEQKKCMKSNKAIQEIQHWLNCSLSSIDSMFAQKDRLAGGSISMSLMQDLRDAVKGCKDELN
mmetsp:Transcript_28786/g.73679  ORF Transcript_28786/g.73679 Transcript_28786/m.73679 type:complete len:116 (-) Transcript_28786:5275-5622(-)